MIRFKLRRQETGDYRVEGLDDASEVFADFVNFETLGIVGVEWLLAEMREVLAGSAPAINRNCNMYELVADKERVRVSFRDELGVCATADFVAYLEEILHRADLLARLGR